MCVVCMKQGGGAGGIFVSFPCATPPPPFLMTFPLVLVGGHPPTLLWTLGGGGLWDGGCRLTVRLTGHQYINEHSPCPIHHGGSMKNVCRGVWMRRRGRC